MRRPHLPGLEEPRPLAVPAQGGGGGAGRAVGRGAPAALRPCLPPPHSAHSFAGVRSRPPNPRGVSDPGLQRAAPFPAGALRLLPPFLSPPDLLTREEGRWWREEGRKPLPAALSKKHNNLAQCRRAGLAPAEQRGALFSPVVSWPFDLSAAGEMLLLTFG